jgi:hypothetical protein
MARRKSKSQRSRSSDPDPNYNRRRYRRFNLQCPVRLAFQSGDALAEFDAFSENVSSGGILLNSPWMIPPGTTLTLVMTVLRHRLGPPLRLVAEGNAVRMESNPVDGSYAIGVRFKTPVTEIEAHPDFVLLKPPPATNSN